MRPGEPQMSAALTSVEACFAIDAVILEVTQRFQSDAGDLIRDVPFHHRRQLRDHVIERLDAELAACAVFELAVCLVQLDLIAGGHELALGRTFQQQVAGKQRPRHRPEIHIHARNPAIPGENLVEVDVEGTVHITAVGLATE